MKRDVWRKGISVGVATSLVILVFIVLIPSATTAVKVSGGIPSNSSVNVGTTIFFQDVNVTIRAAEAIPVNFLTFEIFNSSTGQRVGWVRFTITGEEMSENPPGAFTVENLTDTSALPHQCRGNYYGYDEQTGVNVTGFHHGFGYGYGYGNPDLVIVYNITYTTNKQGTYYAKLFVKATKYTYSSAKTPFFTVLPHLPLSVPVDIKPWCWPNRLDPRDHGYLEIAVLGTNALDVRTIDFRTFTLSLNNGKTTVKPIGWWFKDIRPRGSSVKSKGDGHLDLIFIFRSNQVIQGLQLLKYQGMTIQLTLTGSLKKTLESASVIGYDSLQITKLPKK